MSRYNTSTHIHTLSFPSCKYAFISCFSFFYLSVIGAQYTWALHVFVHSPQNTDVTPMATSGGRNTSTSPWPWGVRVRLAIDEHQAVSSQAVNIAAKIYRCWEVSDDRPFAQLWPRNEVRGIAGWNRLRCMCFSFELSFSSALELSWRYTTQAFLKYVSDE